MESFNEVFELVRQYCSQNMSEVAFNFLIRDMKPVSFDGMTARLSVPSSFIKTTAEKRCLTILKDAFTDAMGLDVEIEFIVADAGDENKASFQNDNINGITPMNYTFDTFIIGSSNEFAHAASLAVANNPANAYNPLLIYGGSGLGKTHLMSAICTQIHKSHPDFTILFVKCESFANELIDAIKNNTTSTVHEKYRRIDVLAVDDIQFIAGKASMQEEFFHTFNTLYHAGKQIILTSDRPPREMKNLEERLRTRLEGGLLADIQPPDFELRAAILRSKAESLGMDLPDDVADYIATRIKKDIRQLEGVTKKMYALQKFAGAPPTIIQAQKAIQDIYSEHQPLPMTVERVIAEVSRTYNVSVEDIRSPKQIGSVSAARQVAMYVLREVTHMSTSEIGKEFSGKDHSTVVYAIKKVEKKMKENSSYKGIIEDIIKNVQSSR